MNTAALLEPEERRLLCELFATPPGSTAGVKCFDPSVTDTTQVSLSGSVLPLLSQLNHFVLHARQGNHHFSFHLHVAHDEVGEVVLRVTAPTIMDTAGDHPRAWRSDCCGDVHLTDASGRQLDWQVCNLSSTGMQLDGQLPLLQNGRLEGCLTVPDVSPIPVIASLVRQEGAPTGRPRCVLRLHLSRTMRARLNRFLYLQHQRQYPSLEWCE